MVLKGKKTATTCLYDGKIDEVGSESILLYNNQTEACVIRTLKNIVCKFRDVDWDIASLEGENKSLEEWRKEHYNFFKSLDTDFTFDTKVLIEVFEVVSILKNGD